MAAQHLIMNPDETRGIDELVQHYRALAAPVANLLSEEVLEQAEMIEFARQQRDQWFHLGYDEMAEQIDAHLESEFPGTSWQERLTIIELVAP